MAVCGVCMTSGCVVVLPKLCAWLYCLRTMMMYCPGACHMIYAVLPRDGVQYCLQYVLPGACSIVLPRVEVLYCLHNCYLSRLNPRRVICITPISWCTCFSTASSCSTPWARMHASFELGMHRCIPCRRQHSKTAAATAGNVSFVVMPFDSVTSFVFSPHSLLFLITLHPGCTKSCTQLGAHFLWCTAAHRSGLLFHILLHSSD